MPNFNQDSPTEHVLELIPQALEEEPDLEYIHKVQRAFNYLEADEALVVVLCDTRDRSPEDIAVDSKLPKDEVRRLLIKGRQHLMKILVSME